MYNTTMTRESKTLIHPELVETQDTKINLICYEEFKFEEKEVINLEECFSLVGKSGTVWLNISGPMRNNVLESLARFFGILPPELEEILNSETYVTSEQFSANTYIPLKVIHFSDEINDIVNVQVDLVLRSNCLISICNNAPWKIFEPVRDRIRSNKDSIRQTTVDYLVCSLIDTVLDNYFVALERFGKKIKLVEESIIKKPSSETLQEIHNLKRTIIFLRNNISFLKDTMNWFQGIKNVSFTEKNKAFLSELHNRTNRTADRIYTLQDTVAAMLEIYLSSVTYKTNEVVRILTIISTIFMPPTFIVGIYGMNFKHMPELDWQFGYPLIMFFIFFIVLLMLLFFKTKRLF